MFAARSLFVPAGAVSLPAVWAIGCQNVFTKYALAKILQFSKT